MIEPDNIANEYFEKARARLLYLIIFFLIILLLSLLGASNIESLGLGLIFSSLLISRILLKFYPLVSIITLGIGSIILNGILIMFIYYFLESIFDPVMKGNIFSFSLFLFIIIILLIFDYNFLNGFYNSVKWAAEKSTLDRSFETLDEEEVRKG